MRYAELFAAHPWRPIRGCPGRFMLPAPVEATPFALSGVEGREHRSARAPDPVLVTPLDEGGLISYRHADGRTLHTLCDAGGFARKLAQLGLVTEAAP